MCRSQSGTRDIAFCVQCTPPWEQLTFSPLVLSVVRWRRRWLFSKHTRSPRRRTRAAPWRSCSDPGRCEELVQALVCVWCAQGFWFLTLKLGIGFHCPDQVWLDEQSLTVIFHYLHHILHFLDSRTPEMWFCVFFLCSQGQ